MKKRIAILILLAAVASACGSASGVSSDVPSGSLPIVSRVEPAAGSSGDAITVYGVGFSSAAPYNIVIIGGAGVSATSYELLPNPSGDEVEAITTTVPTGALAGEDSVVVMVHENVSNADVMFTVN